MRVNIFNRNGGFIDKNSPGQSQTAELIFNPAGYHNNVMQNISLTA